jgi:serine O-acetyltransferase
MWPEIEYDGDTVGAWAGTSQWRAWRADLSRFRKHGLNGWCSEGFWALSLYRAQRGIRKRRPRFVWLPAALALAFAKKLFTGVTHMNLHPDAEIGPGFIIFHVGPLQVIAKARIGADCATHHVTTIGRGSRPGVPVIGDHVMIGCHTCILGPVTVGNYAKIGAGAVVATDIPAGATAVGVPARVISGSGSCSADPAAFAGAHHQLEAEASEA